MGTYSSEMLCHRPPHPFYRPPKPVLPDEDEVNNGQGTDSGSSDSQTSGSSSSTTTDPEQSIVEQLWYEKDKLGILPRTVEQAVYAKDGTRLNKTLDAIRERIAALEQDKAPEIKIVDNLVTEAPYRALSAKQGKVLDEKIAALDAAYKAADTDLDTAYKAADTALDAAYKAADAVVKSGYEAADAALKLLIDEKLTHKIVTFAQYAQLLADDEIEDNCLYLCKKGNRIKTMYIGKLIYNPEDDEVVRISVNFEEAILNAETLKVPTASLTLVGNVGLITINADEGVTTEYDYATDPTTLKMRLNAVNETEEDKVYHVYAVGVNGGLATITITQKAKVEEDE